MLRATQVIAVLIGQKKLKFNFNFTSHPLTDDLCSSLIYQSHPTSNCASAPNKPAVVGMITV